MWLPNTKGDKLRPSQSAVLPLFCAIGLSAASHATDHNVHPEIPTVAIALSWSASPASSQTPISWINSSSFAQRSVLAG